jgi:bacterioferritin-associated ferredoxin
MIVCCCNAFNDRAVDAAISEGARSVAQVYKTLGVAPRCGTCKDVIRGLINDRLALMPCGNVTAPIGALGAASAA